MNNNNFSRREFGLAAGTSLLPFAAAAQPAPGTLTARDVIKRIQQNVGVPWMEKTVDTFKTGNPDTPVKGICTTVMSTMDVLKKSVSSGRQRAIPGGTLDPVPVLRGFVKDAVACGENKPLIILGHVTSEDPGMQECAKWLKTFITEVPIEWISAGEPFWTPS